MARYTAGECYAYTGRQAEMIRSALDSIVSAYQPLTFSNAVKKYELDGEMSGIQDEMRRCIETLNNAAFSPTGF